MENTLIISTTIKRKWLDKILSGEKKIEYKGDTLFWNKRLCKIVRAKMLQPDIKVIINFLCGRESYKFQVLAVERNIDSGMDIDGTFYEKYWEIHLGEQIK